MHSLEDIPSSMSNLNIRDSLKFLHRNSVKNSIHSLAIERSYFFLRSLPLTNRSSGLLPSVFNRVPDSVINRFQKCFHPYFPISIIILIKVRRNNRECPCSMTTGVKDQLKDQRINNKRATCSDTTCWFLDPLKQLD